MFKLKSKLFKLIFVSAIFCFSNISCAYAEAIIVASQKSSFTDLDSRTAKKLWMGKKKRLNGKKVTIVDQKDGNEVQSEFYEKLLGKSSDEMKAYWAKLVFTGSTFPPRKLEDDRKIKDWLAKHPNAIGYIDSESLDDSVRVLLKIK